MFGSTVLDVVVGLIFLFLAVSLAASAVTEAIGSAFKLRQRTLRAGIGALLNDPTFSGLALSLYKHALVSPLGSGVASTAAQLRNNPAYIRPRAFSLALVDVLRNPAVQDAPADLASAIDRIADPQLKGVLGALLADAKGDVDAFVAAVGEWFDDAMARLSGWYKRYTQVISAVVALLICGAVDADALRVGTALWQRPALAAQLETGDAQSVDHLVAALDRASLIGWRASDFKDPRTDPGGFADMVLGWVIVAGASLFGAPFWFDLLQRFVKVAGTGPATGKADDKPSTT